MDSQEHAKMHGKCLCLMETRQCSLSKLSLCCWPTSDK